MTNTTLDELTIRGYEKEEMMKAKTKTSTTY